uniref:BHLH domain-containing protein n=1 Tax=Ananas comosus var. bracteatus TaxID=296719 RepID=A0A6V7QJ13_ANACO|nr:unnamed protein product [Ananas comosus var. bracteatus]
MDSNHYTEILYCLSPHPHIANMDSLFRLSTEARKRFLQSVSGILGCSYICLWSPHSTYLICEDWWFHEDDGAQPSSLSKILFDAYRSSPCSIVTGCVPGWAYMERLPSIELIGSNLVNSASMQVQQQFYQTAIFMGCQNGEIELGMTTTTTSNQHANEHPASFLRGFHPTIVVRRPPSVVIVLFVAVSLDGKPTRILLFQGKHFFFHAPEAYARLPFPTPAADDAAMAQAMLAVISSSPPPSLLYQPPQREQAPRQRAFKAYNAVLRPKTDPVKPRVPGQKMIKMAVSMLKRIHMMRFEARMPEPRPTSNQLHHMISERRRREKINESFHALRMLLPPGSKKDKASVLAKTKEYVNTLKAQISELEEKNRMLESQLPPPTEQMKQVDSGDSSNRVEVQISSGSESTSETRQINLNVIVRVECDTIDVLLRILEFLKGNGNINLVSINARSTQPQSNTYASANLTFQDKVNPPTKYNSQ